MFQSLAQNWRGKLTIRFTVLTGVALFGVSCVSTFISATIERSTLTENLQSQAVRLADMFGANVVVVQVAGFFHRIFDDLLGTRCLGQLAHRHHFGPALNQLLHLEADLSQVDVEILQHIRCDATAFLD